MGFVGVFEAGTGAVEARAATGRIGAAARVFETTATLIEPPAAPGGAWIFGPEVGVERRETARDLGRRTAAGVRVVPFLRSEFRVAITARHLGLGPGSTLLVGEMPLGQRRVHALRLQDYSKRLDPVVFEDLDELDPPLDAPAARAEAKDWEAVSALGQMMRRNPFVSDRFFSASLSSGDAGAFRSYEDDGKASAKWHKDAAYAVGIVADAAAARAGVYAHPRLMRLFDASGAGRLRTRVGGETRELALPPEVSDKAPAHLDLAVVQALCGAGRRTEGWAGRPVGDYACYLFEQHLLEAARRREGDLMPTLGWPERFEPMSEDGLEWRPGLEGEEDPDDALGLPRVPR